LEKIDNHKSYIKDLKQKLSGEKLEELDFDRLVVWLDEISQSIDNSNKLETEYNTLRDDISARISGMLKAISAVGKNNKKMKDNLLTIESLNNKNSQELLHEYQKTLAKFKDSFPASFGYLNQSNFSKKRDWQSYK
jgi:hypothetical protein